MRVAAPNLLRLTLAAALALAGACATAQVLPPGPARVYPMGSLMGYATFGAGPTLSVNCVSYPLGPGLRVENTQQRVILQGQLPGLQGPVVFQRDSMGNVFRVWMLRANQVVSGVPAAPNRCLFRQF